MPKCKHTRVYRGTILNKCEFGKKPPANGRWHGDYELTSEEVMEMSPQLVGLPMKYQHNDSMRQVGEVLESHPFQDANGRWDIVFRVGAPCSAFNETSPNHTDLLPIEAATRVMNGDLPGLSLSHMPGVPARKQPNKAIEVSICAEGRREGTTGTLQDVSHLYELPTCRCYPVQAARAVANPKTFLAMQRYISLASKRNCNQKTKAPISASSMSQEPQTTNNSAPMEVQAPAPEQPAAVPEPQAAQAAPAPAAAAADPTPFADPQALVEELQAIDELPEGEEKKARMAAYHGRSIVSFRDAQIAQKQIEEDAKAKLDALIKEKNDTRNAILSMQKDVWGQMREPPVGKELKSIMASNDNKDGSCVEQIEWTHHMLRKVLPTLGQDPEEQQQQAVNAARAPKRKASIYSGLLQPRPAPAQPRHSLQAPVPQNAWSSSANVSSSNMYHGNNNRTVDAAAPVGANPYARFVIPPANSSGGPHGVSVATRITR